MRSIDLRIDEILLEAEVDDAQLGRTEPAIRRALELLAQRLAASPFARTGEAPALALNEIRISALSLKELLGPGGAERLAEELYTRIATEAR